MRQNLIFHIIIYIFAIFNRIIHLILHVSALYFPAPRPGRGVLVFLPAAGTEGSLLYCPRPGCGAFVFLPAAGTVESLFCFPRPGCGAFVFLPAAGAWVSALNLLTKIPSLFENIGTRGHQSAFLAHFTYESLLWRRKTGTGAGVDVI